MPTLIQIKILKFFVKNINKQSFEVFEWITWKLESSVAINTR